MTVFKSGQIYNTNSTHQKMMSFNHKNINLILYTRLKQTILNHLKYETD